MSAGWLNFGTLDLGEGESMFNRPVAGGNMLGEGKHEVRVMSIEAEPKFNKLKVRCENDQQQGINADIFIFEYQKTTPSTRLIEFLRALLGSQSEVMAYLKAMAAAPQLIQACVGLKLGITVQNGKRGYDTSKNAEGELVLVSAGDEETTEILKNKVGDRTFETFGDIKEFVDNLNANKDEDEPKLRRAYPDIKSFRRIPEEVATNVAAIQTAIKTGSATGGSKGGHSDTDLLKGAV